MEKLYMGMDIHKEKLAGCIDYTISGNTLTLSQSGYDIYTLTKS